MEFNTIAMGRGTLYRILHLFENQFFSIMQSGRKFNHQSIVWFLLSVQDLKVWEQPTNKKRIFLINPDFHLYCQ